MENEEKGFDAGEFYDEGVDSAGLKDELADAESDDAQHEPSGVIGRDDEPSTSKEKPTQDDTDSLSAALESTEKDDQDQPEEEPESVIQSLLPSPETESDAETGQPSKDQRVPLDDHIKLRQRAQAAERERDELRQQLEKAQTTPTGAEQPGTTEKSPLEVYAEEYPDEDFVPVKVQVEDRKWHEARARQAAEKAEQSRQAAQVQAQERAQAIQSAKDLNVKATDSEKTARQAHTDYDQVTKAALGAKLFSADELREILQSDQPGEAFYAQSKSKLDAIRAGLGLPPVEATEPTAQDKMREEESDTLTDEEIFNEVYGTPS